MRAIVLLFVIALFAQENVDRVLHFTQNETNQDMQEVGTLIRATGDIRQASVDAEQRALTLRGTAAQIALGEWLFNQLDQTPDTIVREYKIGNDDVLRLFYITGATTVQEFQEEVTLV